MSVEVLISVKMLYRCIFDSFWRFCTAKSPIDKKKRRNVSRIGTSYQKYDTSERRSIEMRLKLSVEVCQISVKG
jgi:hypothetical protein